MSFFKLLRIVALLSVLFVVLVGTWMNERRLANWERPVWVTVYPIAVNGSQTALNYAKTINEGSFEDINKFFERNLNLYGVLLTPTFHFQIADVSHELPPAIPVRHDTISIALWSLKMRWWASHTAGEQDSIEPDVRIFVRYHEPGQIFVLENSVGLQKGMVGIVNAYASRRHRGTNNVIIAHEFLHTLGATDKYDPGTGHPIPPDGLADPLKSPLYPQKNAEIMGGRVALAVDDSVVPKSLKYAVIGPLTASEINLTE